MTTKISTLRFLHQFLRYFELYKVLPSEDRSSIQKVQTIKIHSAILGWPSFWHSVFCQRNSLITHYFYVRKRETLPLIVLGQSNFRNFSYKVVITWTLIKQLLLITFYEPDRSLGKWNIFMVDWSELYLGGRIIYFLRGTYTTYFYPNILSIRHFYISIHRKYLEIRICHENIKLFHDVCSYVNSLIHKKVLCLAIFPVEMSLVLFWDNNPAV